MTSRFGIVSLLVISGFAAHAQSSWSTSKDVNKVANKDLFENEDLAKTHITATSLIYPSVVSQKGVSRVSMNAGVEKNTGNMVSRGTPSFAMSKGVSLIGTSRRSSKVKHAPESTEPLIPIDRKETNKQ